MKENKATRKDRIKKWVDDYSEEIFMGTLFVGGCAVSFILGRVFGYGKGASYAFNESMKGHREVCKSLVDECGHEGAFTALKMVRDDKNAMNLLMNDPDKVLCAVGEKYYASEYIQKLMEHYTA